MKMLGKSTMRKILARETGLPMKHIKEHCEYKRTGGKETIKIGAHSICSCNGRVTISYPVYGSFEDDGSEITYRIRDVELKENERTRLETDMHSEN